MAALLSALDRSILGMRSLARRARDEIGHHSFLGYHAYRKGIDEYRALRVVLLDALRTVEPAARPYVQDRLLRAERDFLNLTIKAAFSFFFALSAVPVLPLGIRELFMRELESLSEARDRLRSDDHAGHLAPDLLGDLETAEQILEEIMDKAPSLLDFDALEHAAPASAGRVA